VSKALAKFIAPTPDRLVSHDYTAFKEQLLNVAQAQLEAEVPTHGATDNFSWESVTVIQRFRFRHHVITSSYVIGQPDSAGPPSVKLTMPFQSMLGDIGIFFE
jgi:hypothetical protein